MCNIGVNILQLVEIFTINFNPIILEKKKSNLIFHGLFSAPQKETNS